MAVKQFHKEKGENEAGQLFLLVEMLRSYYVWSRKLIAQIGNPGKNMGISRKGAIQQRLHMRNVRLLP